MKRIYFLLMSMLLPLTAWCQDGQTTLTVEPFTITAGETIEVLAEMQSSDEDLCQAQFDLVLPTGLSVPTRNGKYYILGAPTGVIEYDEELGYSHEIGSALQADNSIRVVVVNSANKRFVSNSGTLVRIRLKADENISPGTYTLTLRNVEFTHDNATKEAVESSSTTVTVPGEVTPVEGTAISIAPFSISAGETVEMMVEMESSSDDLCQAQFDLILPAGLSVPTRSGRYYILGSPTGVIEYDEDLGYSHQIGSALQDDGSIRVVIVNSDNKRFISNKGTLVRVRLQADANIASGTYTILLKNVEFTHDNATKEAVDDYSTTITIDGVTPDVHDQTVSLTTLPTITYGDASYTLPATTEQGLTLTWTSSNAEVATVSGNILEVVKPGSATITATQEGNDSYNAFSREYTLTVSKAVLTVTAGNCSKVQWAEIPPLQITYSGFKNDDDESSLTTQPTVSTEATKDSPEGTYPITVSGGESPYYSFNYVNGTLTVTEALLGDINRDGKVTIADVTALVDIILGKAPH